MATVAGPATVQLGATNIVIWWDYLQASEVNSLPGWSKRWKVVIPSDASYAAYYDQAINKDAPDPAAARLWEEYLYSTDRTEPLAGRGGPTDRVALPGGPPPGQHKGAGRLACRRRPGVTKFPTQAQLSAAKAVVAADWPTEIGTGP